MKNTTKQTHVQKPTLAKHVFLLLFLFLGLYTHAKSYTDTLKFKSYLNQTDINQDVVQTIHNTNWYFFDFEKKEESEITESKHFYLSFFPFTTEYKTIKTHYIKGFYETSRIIESVSQLPLYVMFCQWKSFLLHS